MATPFAGRFSLVDPLGEGGSGTVWRAWDLRDQQYVAAKVLRQVDAGSLVRFMREQSTRIQHPHVLMPTGWAGEDDRVLLTMPLVAGGSLASLTGDFWPLPDAWVARIAHQALLALQAVHAAGVVHRDVTPANLLLDATGIGEPRLRLSDFGIAKHRDDPRLTTGPFAVGTAGFRPPEAFEADPEPRQDVFALGASLAALSETPYVEALTVPMMATDPAERPGVDHLLQVIQLSGLLSEPLGSEVEVFDHLPPLPEGWGPEGPLSKTSRSSGASPTAVANPLAGDAPLRPHRQRPQGLGPLIGSGLAILAGAAALTAAVLF